MPQFNAISTHKQEIYKALTEVGLSENARQLYLLINQDPEQNLSKQAKTLGISRPHLYKMLTELKVAGLICYGQKKSDIKLQPPSEILALIRKKKSQTTNVESAFANVLPDLMDRYEQGDMPSKIKVIKGQNNFLKLFFQIIEEEKQMSEYFGAAHHFLDLISWEVERKWIKARMKNGMRIRALLLPSKDARTLQKSDALELRETRIFLSPSPFEASFQLFANKLIFWQPKAKMAILVEDEYLVAMMKSMYYYCWEKSK